MSGTSLLRFLEHSFIRYRATWVSTLVSSSVAPVLFLLAIGFGLGSQVEDTSRLGTDDYVSFIGPGILAGLAMVQAGGLSLWPTLGALKWEGNYQAVLATPLTAAELATGHILWIGARVVFGATAYMVVLTAFGVTASPLGILAPIVAGLTGIAFAGPLSAFSAGLENDNYFGPVSRVVLTPLFLFSGAFYPIGDMPAWLQAVALIAPVSHGVELSRGFVNGSIGMTPALGHLAYLSLWMVVGWWLAVRAFRGRLAS